MPQLKSLGSHLVSIMGSQYETEKLKDIDAFVILEIIFTMTLVMMWSVRGYTGMT